jgi:hypothetical protein
MEVAPGLNPPPGIADSSLRTVRALPAAAGAPDGFPSPVLAGHEYDMSGVFATAPRDAPGPGAALLRATHCHRPAAPRAGAELTRCARAVTWRESVVVGHTSLEPHEVQDVVQQLGYEFRGNSYHLLERNCARPSPRPARDPPRRRSARAGATVAPAAPQLGAWQAAARGARRRDAPRAAPPEPRAPGRAGNHFSDALCEKLAGARAPPWVRPLERARRALAVGQAGQASARQTGRPACSEQGGRRARGRSAGRVVSMRRVCILP